MLTLSEQVDVMQSVDIFDAQFTDDIIDAADSYEIEEDPITLQTTVTLFDVNGAVLSTATVEDYDVAMAYLEEVFDLEEYDPEEADAQAAAGASQFGHAM